MKDVYQEITNKIVAAMEHAGRSGERWKLNSSGQGRPVNVRGMAYRGVNVPILWAAAAEKSYTSATWGTFKAWQERDAYVRKGERGTGIVVWKRVDHQPKPGEDDAGYSLFARGFHVFNAAQVNGYSEPQPANDSPSPMAQRIATIDAFMTATGATIEHHGVRAFYKHPPADKIVMPPLELFHDSWGYYATLLHEAVHWTGARPRLCRQMGKRFGDEAYAGEELVAEIGAAFMCADLGLADQPRDDHAAYVKNWIRALKNDNRAIFSAASEAQKACDFLHGLQEDAADEDGAEAEFARFG